MVVENQKPEGARPRPSGDVREAVAELSHRSSDDSEGMVSLLEDEIADEMRTIFNGAVRSKVAVSDSVYGLFMLRLVQGWHVGFRNMEMGSLFTRQLHAFLLYGLNLAMQGCALIFLLGVAEDLERPWERNHFLNHYNVSTADAAVQMDTAVAYGRPDVVLEEFVSLCRVQTQVPHPNIYIMMVFWWMAFMMKEIRAIERVFQAIWQLDTAADSSQKLMSEDGCIIALTIWQKVVFMIVNPMVKSCIAFPLAYAGCKFLVLQTQPLSLIVKSLAMQLVLGLDDLLIASLASDRIQSQIKNMKFLRHGFEDEMLEKVHWHEGLGGLVYLAISLAVVFCFFFFVFFDLMSFRNSCHAYQDAFPHDMDRAPVLRRLLGDVDDLFI
jgi:hypothetical protein